MLIFWPAEKNWLLEMSLPDFKKAAISALTQKHKTSRKKYLKGNQIKYTRLMNCIIDTQNDWVLFEWLSIATPNTDNKKEVDPFADFDLKNNPSKLYELKIRLDGFFTWLLGTLPDGQPVSKQDMFDAMNICSLKYWASVPSFHWQGHNYNLSQLDASLHPTTIKPKVWNKFHGKTFLDKHSAVLFKNINFYLPQMAQMLNAKLRKVNII